MAYSREVLGVHYPSDSEMGRILARNLVNEFFKKEKFQKDFEAAKKEVLEYRKKAGTIKLKSENTQAAKVSSSCEPACSSACSSTCCK